MQIPLARPDITDAEIEAVVEVLRTSHLALGPKLKESSRTRLLTMLAFAMPLS